MDRIEHSRAATGRFSSLDGLRACAAATVLAYHVALACSLTRVGPLAPLLAQLKAGVAVFFVLSGFLLYLPYARALAVREPLPDWRLYMHRRALRILPGYWAALTLLAPGLLRASLAGPDWWRYYGLAQIYRGTTVMGGLGVAWSLCVEVTFYACLPLFARAAARLLRCRWRAVTPARAQVTVISTLALGTVALRLGLAGSGTAPIPHAGFVLATALPGFLDWFAAGMAMAVLTTAWSAGERTLPSLRALADHPALCWALAAGCFVTVGLTNRDDLFLPLYGLTAHIGIGIGSALLLLPALSRSLGTARSVVTRFLECRTMVWVGTVSYGVYLWHVPLLEAIHGPLAPLDHRPQSLIAASGLFVLVLAGSIALGAASWYVIERPASRALSRPRRLAVDGAR